MNLDQIKPSPWSRLDWTGALLSVDGTATDDFARDDVARVVAWATTDRFELDGNTACIVELRDGRFVSWEADWGPTGDGFRCGAYGGDADINFAATEDAARMALSVRARDLLAGWRSSARGTTDEPAKGRRNGA